MTHDKDTKTAKPPCDPIPFTEVPTDLVARLTQEADRRCVHGPDAPAMVPLAHQVILARRED